MTQKNTAEKTPASADQEKRLRQLRGAVAFSSHRFVLKLGKKPSGKKQEESKIGREQVLMIILAIAAVAYLLLYTNIFSSGPTTSPVTTEQLEEFKVESQKNKVPSEMDN